MSDPNPYQPSREPEPLTKAPAPAKLGIGLLAIVLLTPVATFAAFFASCSAAVAFGNPYSPGVLTWAVLIVPPVATFAGMVWWAVRTATKRRNP